MQADELRTAVNNVVSLIKKSDLRTAIDKYRVAKGEQSKQAAEKLAHAGVFLVEKITAMPPLEQQLLRCLHLEELGSTSYWHRVLGGDSDPKAHRAEVVRLASRVMFATSHMPAMVAMLGAVKAPSAHFSGQAAGQDFSFLQLEEGQGALYIRLTDAGERASDPDRIARAIDGIDMLYSACASIARKPAIDLRLDNISAKLNRDRDFRFTGERDSITAVFAVIDSISSALADIDPDQDIDLDAVVRSLPIFEDLATLGSLGTFSSKDLKDISETMHQGGLLTLESGVILIDEQAAQQGATASEGSQLNGAAGHGANGNGDLSYHSVTGGHSPGSSSSQEEDDEHYNRYLREREAMMNPNGGAQAESANGQAGGDLSGLFGMNESEAEDRARKDAVDELLRSLGQSRTS